MSLVLMSVMLAAGPFYDDYTEAYNHAQSNKTMMLIDFGSEIELNEDYTLWDGWTVVKLPKDSLIADTEPFKEWEVRGGFVICDFKSDGSVVFWLPAKYVSRKDVQIMLSIKAGTITQRALAWAVKRSDRPSANGDPASDLLNHARSHSMSMAARHDLFHNLPGNASGEICAMAIGDSVHDAAINAVSNWSTSSGHNQLMSSTWNAYGYDIIHNGGFWYAVGVFR